MPLPAQWHQEQPGQGHVVAPSNFAATVPDLEDDARPGWQRNRLDSLGLDPAAGERFFEDAVVACQQSPSP